MLRKLTRLGVLTAALAGAASAADARSSTVRASWYGGHEGLNAHTSTGERFRPSGLTAAHRSLPFGTRIRVCYKGCVVVQVNDRGPAAWTGRAVDLSRGAAGVIGLLRVGVARVRVAIVN